MNYNKNTRGRLSITARSENTQLLYDWLEETFSISPVETCRPQSSIVQLDAYFETLMHAQIALQVLPNSLPILHADATELCAEEWTTFWQHHFKLEEIGRHLRIVPYWEEPPDDHRKNLIINPGLSFGTGGHFTTRFCLEQLEIALQQKQPQSFLDAGSGSGILSIAAHKLGIKHIHAFDLDPIATEQAQANASINQISLLPNRKPTRRRPSSAKSRSHLCQYSHRSAPSSRSKTPSNCKSKTHSIWDS